MQARPPVSLDRRSGEDPGPDVICSGSEHEPRLTPSARRRMRLGCVVIIVAILAVAAGLEVQERRDAAAQAAEARRLAELPKLSAFGPFGFGLEADPPPSLSAVLDMEMRLRNDGQRDVTVTAADAGGFVLLAPVSIPVGQVRPVVLHHKVHCNAATPPPSERIPAGPTTDPLEWPGPLQVTARTSRGTHTITVARPPYFTEHPALACEWLRAGRPAFESG